MLTPSTKWRVPFCRFRRPPKLELVVKDLWPARRKPGGARRPRGTLDVAGGRPAARQDDDLVQRAPTVDSAGTYRSVVLSSVTSPDHSCIPTRGQLISERDLVSCVGALTITAMTTWTRANHDNLVGKHDTYLSDYLHRYKSPPPTNQVNQTTIPPKVPSLAVAGRCSWGRDDEVVQKVIYPHICFLIGMYGERQTLCLCIDAF